MSDLPAPQPDQNLPAPPPHPNPYVGPRAYQWGERIYGRDQETYRLANLLSAERILLFYSPSGAGKTSLIHAALIPELQEREFHLRAVARVNREPANPPASLPPSYNRYIFSTLSWLDSAWPESEQIPEEELVGMRLVDYLERRPRPEGFKFEVFIFDQFEEILTLDATDLAAKHEFFKQIGDLLGDRIRWGLFSMREDFIAALEPYVLPIPTRFSTTFRLELLGVEAARQAMQGPAKEAGVEFTRLAADSLIDDLRQVQVQNPDGTYRAQLGPFVEPVQLQVVCHRLWESLDSGTTRIDPQHLAGIKNVGQALAEYYALRVAEAAQGASVSERLIRQWFENELITEGGVRGQVLMGAHSSRGLNNEAIRLLENAHLVRAEKRGNSIWFELSHDRLIEPVKDNNDVWFEHNLSLLQRQASLWEERKRNEALLLREKALEEAEAWAIAHATEMTSTEREYLKACQENRKREVDAKDLVEKEIQLQEQGKAAVRLRRRAYILTAVLLVTLVVTIVAIFLGNQAIKNASIAQVNLNVADTANANEAIQRQTAVAASTQALEQKNLAEAASTQALEQKNLAEAASTQAVEQKNLAITAEADALKQRDIANSGQMASASERVIQTSPDLSLLLAIEALRITNTVDAQSSLLQGLSADYPLAYLRGNTSSMDDLEFSPDSQWLATASGDSTRLWSVDNPSVITQTIVDTYGAARVAFSPDGKYLATLSCYYSIVVHDINQGEYPRLVKIYPYPTYTGCSGTNVGDLAFSPDGETLAASLNSNHINLWNITTNQVFTLTGAASPVTRLVFTPDGNLLASGDESGKVFLWDVHTGAPAQPRLAESPLTHTITLLVFLDSGSESPGLAAIDSEGMAAVWDTTYNSLLSEPQDLGAKNITALSFNAQLIASLEGNTVKVGSYVADLRSLTGHTTPVTSVAISPDGTLVASGSNGGEVILWGMVSHVLEGSPIETTDPILSLAYNTSDNGKTLIGGSQDHALTWDPTSHQLLHALTLPLTVTMQITLTPDSLSFRPDGKLLAAGTDGTAFVWDPVTRQSSHILASKLSSIYINDITTSPGGEKIAIGGYGIVAVWNLTTSQILTNTGDSSTIYNLTFSPDGNTLAYSSYYSSVVLWDLTTRSLNDKINAGSGSITSIAFSPDGSRLATGDYYNDVYVWDIRTSELITSLYTSQGTIQALAFSPDGNYLASGGSDGSVIIWDLNTGATMTPVYGGSAAIQRLAFNQDGRMLASGDSDGLIQLLKTTSESFLNGSWTSTPLAGHNGSVTDLVFSSVGGGNEQILLASASNDNTVRVWDAHTGQQVGDPLVGQVWRSFIPATNSLAASPDGSKMAISSTDRGLITLFDLTSTPPVTQSLIAHQGTVNVLAFSQDGHYLASSGSDGKLILWDASTGMRLDTWTLPLNVNFKILKFSPDDNTLAASSGINIYHWSIFPHKDIGSPLLGHVTDVLNLAFSQDGRSLASQESNGTIFLWVAASDRLMRKIDNPVSYSISDKVDTLAFSPDGKILASGYSTEQNAISLWDVASGRLVGNLTGNRTTIINLAFNPDGSTLVTSGQDNRILFWMISLSAWKERACDLAGRNLSWQEWETYLAGTGQVYRATCPSNPIDYNDVVQGYAEQILFWAKAQEDDQVHQVFDQAMSLITQYQALDPAVTLCLLDLPSAYLETQAPACHLAAKLTTKHIDSARYLLKINDLGAAEQSLQQAAQDAIRARNLTDATQVCDYGITNHLLDSVTTACQYTAETSGDIKVQVDYYLKAEEVVSATVVLQRATQQVIESKIFDQAVVICELGNDNHLSTAVVKACLFAAENAPDDISRIEFYSLGGEAQKAIQVLQDATRLAKNTNDSSTAGTLCITGARYHLQPNNREACLFAAENAYDYITIGDFYYLAGDEQKARVEFSLALTDTLNSSYAADNNHLCWRGSIDGFADLVMPACENAVENAAISSLPHYRDSRGLARALCVFETDNICDIEGFIRGDIEGYTKGAIEDFQYFIDWLKTDGYYYFDDTTRDRYIAERQSWIEALLDGSNPFDADTLMVLRNE